MERAPPELPQEIINAVVADYAIQTDSKALKTLGLVSRAWSHPTREHLFHAIAIDMQSCPGLQKRLDALKALLQGRPLLCQYIKSLAINVGAFSESLSSEAELKSHMWMDTPIDFLSLLTSLTHVTHVDVGIPVGRRTGSGCLPHSFQAALQTLFARPHVTSVSLSCIEIDLVPLTQYRHIERLALHGVKVPAWSQACCFPMNRLPTTPKCLRVLNLSQVSPLVWRILALCCASTEAALNLGEIKVLTVISAERPILFETLTDEQWDTIFDTYGGSVESYTVRHSNYDSDLFPVFIPLRSFPNLEQLSLEIVGDSRHGGLGSMPAFVHALEELSQLDKPTNISSIRLKRFGCARYIKLEVEACRERDLWARLDGILEGHAFPSLKEVIFTIEIRCCNWVGFADMLHTQLPSLSRRRILTLRRSFVQCRGDPLFNPPLIVKTFSR